MIGRQGAARTPKAKSWVHVGLVIIYQWVDGLDKIAAAIRVYENDARHIERSWLKLLHP